MDRTKTRKIKDVIREFLKENRLDSRLKERELINSWEELMGRTISRATKKIYISKGKLVVFLTSSVIRSELFVLKEEIVRKLNEKVGENVISDLVLK